MSDVADRFRSVAARFTAAVAAVDDGAWSNPSPCDGWSARDVVAHLVEWIPGPGFLLGSFGITTGPTPLVADDPLGAWAVVRDAVQTGLDDPATAARTADCGPLGSISFETAVAMTVISDVFVHTWDVARAAGLDSAPDPVELDRQFDAVTATPPEIDAAMRASGHFGPRTPLAAGAGPLETVLSFYGRRADH